MNIKLAESIFTGILIACVGCQVSQSGLKTREMTEKASTYTYPSPPIAIDDYFFSHADLLMEQPDEKELGYGVKEVTLDFSAYDKYQIDATDPKLFKENNTELIDLGLIGEEDYSLPMKNPRIVSPYAGKRVNHTGIDLTARKRDPIYATFDGIVRVARQSTTYGNVIVVRHYNGLETVYSHNTTNMVKPGDEVKAGQQIAISGSTGRASGDHLHFEVRINGQHFNPELLFDFKAQKLQEKTLFCFKNKKQIEVSLVDPFLSYLSDTIYSPENKLLEEYKEWKYMT